MVTFLKLPLDGLGRHHVPSFVLLIIQLIEHLEDNGGGLKREETWQCQFIEHQYNKLIKMLDI